MSPGGDEIEQTETWRPPGLGRQAPVRPLLLAVGTRLRAEQLFSRLPEHKGQVQPSVPPPPCLPLSCVTRWLYYKSQLRHRLGFCQANLFSQAGGRRQVLSTPSVEGEPVMSLSGATCSRSAAPRATLLHVHLSAHGFRLLPASGQSRAACAAHFQHDQGLQSHFPSVHEGTRGPAEARTQQDSGMINHCPRCDSTVGIQASWQDTRQQRVPFSLSPSLGLQRN